MRHLIIKKLAFLRTRTNNDKREKEKGNLPQPKGNLPQPLPRRGVRRRREKIEGNKDLPQPLPRRGECRRREEIEGNRGLPQPLPRRGERRRREEIEGNRGLPRPKRNLPRPLPRRGECRRWEEVEERGKYNGHAFGNILCHETTEDTENGSAASDRTNGSCPAHTG